MTWEDCVDKGLDWVLEGQAGFRPEEPSEEGIPDGAQWSKKGQVTHQL